jgi:hypothetical protein
MSTLAPKLQELTEFYRTMEVDLAKILNVAETNDAEALIDSILKNHDCLAQIEHMRARVLQLTGEFKMDQSHLDLKSQNEIQTLAADAKERAIRLHELCAVAAPKIEAERNRLAQELQFMSKGSQYLKSVKPIKNNYPKFIDSDY